MSTPPRRVRDVVAAWAIVRLTRRGRDTGAAPAEPPGVPPPNIERELPSTPQAEKAAIVLLFLAALGAIAFMVLYIVLPDTQALGGALGGAVLCLGLALIVVGKRIVPQEKTVEEREDFGDPEAQREAAAIVRRGGEGISRRKMLFGAAGAAGTTLGAAAAFPLASLGPNVGDLLDESPWERGRRVVDAEGKPLRLSDIEPGTFRTGFPEGASHRLLGAPLILVRLDASELQVSPERITGMPFGIAAFSKICPHAGCAISMYRHPLYKPTEPEPALVCPCHYSTFAPHKGGKLIFGPAGRDLPQLPIMLNEADELVAAGPYYDGYGPSWGGVRTPEND